MMFQSEGMVIDVVCRSNLQTTCTELNVNIVVLYNRNLSSYERNDNVFASQPCVLWVVRVDTHCRITHDCLRTCGSNYSIIAFLILMHHVSFFHLLAVILHNPVLQIVEL